MDSALPTSSPELPRPEHSTSPQNSETVLPVVDKKETVSDTKERLATANDAVAQAVYGATTQGSLPQSAVPQVDDQVPAQAPSLADDVPVIEKEWVQIARSIVRRTKDDPRQQTIEMGVFKSDYVRKRFGKELKANEDAQRTGA